jgi:hypothetical protein
MSQTPTLYLTCGSPGRLIPGFERFPAVGATR